MASVSKIQGKDLKEPSERERERQTERKKRKETTKDRKKERTKERKDLAMQALLFPQLGHVSRHIKTRLIH